jgi:3-oxoacyl-[acyl-carrier-protein] synthase II
MLKYLPNMLACQVSILHDAQGPNNTVTENEVAGVQALGEAYRILTRGEADLFLVGGADSKMNPLSMVRQSLFSRLSRRNDSPEKACRPFDRHRDGIVIGEGGGCFVLEDLDHAKKRGAKIYGEVVGFAAGFDIKRNGTGLARVMRQALDEAGISPEEVDHVNAQGFGDIHADIWEAKGIREVFGHCSPVVPVFAAKGYFGNLGAGGGLVELSASLLALGHGVLPPSLNYEESDPECPIPVIAGTPRATVHKHVLKLSFTELGQCAAVVVRKFEG